MTKRIRLAGIVGLLGAGLLSVGTTATAQAAAITPQQTEWSDCLFAQPAPDPNTLIDTYTNTQLNITVSLRCGNHDTADTTGFGVRHINDRHGFDFNTEDCISNIVTQATILDDGIASGTGPRNEAFVFPGRNQLQNGVRGTVIYNVDTKNIVTAYVEGTQGADNWEACASALAPPAENTPSQAGIHGVQATPMPNIWPSAHTARSAAIRPNSATGCTSNFLGTWNVCIDVEGTGLNVDHVVAGEIRYFYVGTYCGTPYVYANGSPYAIGGQVCTNLLTNEIDWTFPLDQNFADQTQVCVKWDNTDLTPCETVHS